MKILVVKLHALGDMVLATPGFARLRSGLPDAQIDLLTTRWAEPAVRDSNLFDHQIVAPTELFFGRGVGSPVKIALLASKLRLLGYEALVVFHRSKQIDLFTRAISFGKRFLFGDQTQGNFIKLDEMKHSALTAWELADLATRRLGGLPADQPSLDQIRYRWDVSKEEEAISRRLLTTEGISGDYAVLCPGGGSNPSVTNSERRWTSGGFAELARWLVSKRGLQVLAVGAESDREPIEQAVVLAKGSIIPLIGKGDVRSLGAILSLSRLVVSNDSAPMHIAAAVGARTLAIFGPTGACTKVPLGAYCSSVSLGLPCSPCYFTKFNGCIFSEIRCMTELPAAYVIAAAADLLDRPDVDE